MIAVAVLVLVTPVLTAVWFGVAYMVFSRLVPGGERRIDRAEPALYSVLLLVVLGLAAVIEPAAYGRISWTGDGPWPIWSLAGLLAGGLFVGVEVAAGWLLGRIAAPATLTDGAGAIKRTSTVGAGGTVAILVAGVLEEFLFRGLALPLLGGGVPAVLATGVVFGLLHWYYGLRNVVTKGLLGIALGVLAAASGGVLAAVAAHLAFSTLAMRFNERIRLAERLEATR